MALPAEPVGLGVGVSSKGLWAGGTYSISEGRWQRGWWGNRGPRAFGTGEQDSPVGAWWAPTRAGCGPALCGFPRLPVLQAHPRS